MATISTWCPNNFVAVPTPTVLRLDETLSESGTTRLVKGKPKA
jgi:hypothetical protein